MEPAPPPAHNAVSGGSTGAPVAGGDSSISAGGDLSMSAGGDLSMSAGGRGAATAPQRFIQLKNPGIAALLAWLIPGAGHFYQGRTAKGWLFMVCILGTFFFGLFLGDGKVVYASWRKDDMRLAYLAQLGAGLPAMPALLQAARGPERAKQFLGGRMRPPQVSAANEPDELAIWHRDLNVRFELGTLYTVIAGLLNILAIYDAYGGPVFPVVQEKKAKNKPDPAGGASAAS